MVNISLKRIKYIVLLIAIFFSVSGYAEVLNVTGRVYDEQEEPLVGVTVTQKNDPKNIVVTDMNGTYNIKVNRGDVIAVSYIGFEPAEKKATGTTVDFILKETTTALNEVVVTGYTTQKKSRCSALRPPLKWKT